MQCHRRDVLHLRGKFKLSQTCCPMFCKVGRTLGNILPSVCYNIAMLLGHGNMWQGIENLFLARCSFKLQRDYYGFTTVS